MSTRRLSTGSAIAVGRRRFLKTGVAGSAVLLAGRWLAPADAAEPSAAGAGFTYLTPRDAVALRRIIPVMLHGALPLDETPRKTAIEEIIGGVDTTVGYQPPGVRKEIRDLFGLLDSGVTRALVAGIWKSWEKATDEDIEQFLTGWRNSRFDLLRTAYIGLQNLIMGSWYANPRSWGHAGYGGAPKIA